MSAATIDLPEPSEHLLAHREALAAGRLTFQRCRNCSNAWLPPRDGCPRCLEADWAWEDASGDARLISWVVYHRAYHDAYADRVPYNVVVVELAEGPRLISNVLDVEGDEGLAIDAPLRVRTGDEAGVPVARFVLAEPAAGASSAAGAASAPGTPS